MKREHKLLLAVSLAILSVSSVFNVMSQTKISLPAAQDSVKFDRNKNQNLQQMQLLRGDFSSLEGQWSSQTDKAEQLHYTIAGNLFLAEQVKYYLQSPSEQADGSLKLGTRSTNQYANSAPLTFYPAGVSIAVRQKDGSIDTSGKTDPSDKSKDRILFAQNILTAEKLAQSVCYRLE